MGRFEKKRSSLWHCNIFCFISYPRSTQSLFFNLMDTHTKLLLLVVVSCCTAAKPFLSGRQPSQAWLAFCALPCSPEFSLWRSRNICRASRQAVASSSALITCPPQSQFLVPCLCLLSALLITLLTQQSYLKASDSEISEGNIVNVPRKFCKIFQILRHIESLDACMEY